MPRVSVELIIGEGQATVGKLWKPNWIIRGIICRTRDIRNKDSRVNFPKNVIT